MYVGRTLQQLQNQPYSKWKIEELAYHRDVMTQMQGCLNDQGQGILSKVMEEMDNRGGLPHYGGDYDGHGTTLHYD